MSIERDLVIVGGGAAGLTAAQYGARANLDVLLIEEMAPGGQAIIIDDLENYPGFPEAIKGYDFSMRMEQQAKNFGADFLSTRVEKIEKKGDRFILSTSSDEIKAKAVILSTGSKHRHLGVPGEEEFRGRGVSYCATCDGPFFKKKKILVVGGGDAACDEAMYLSKLTDKVIIIHRKERFRAQKSLADRVQKNPHIEVRFNTELKEIKGDSKVNQVTLWNNKEGKSYEEEMDAVFVFIGFIPQISMVEGIVEFDEAGNVITDQRMETNLPGLFAAGDVRSTPFRQIVVAAGEGAVAAHCAAQYIDELEGDAYV